jgi:hypothetical protein
MMAMARQQANPQEAQNVAITHMLRRLQPAHQAWAGVLPEVVGTDGSIVRSLHSQARQLIYHESASTPPALRLRQQIERCVSSPGASLVGYSHFKNSQEVAFLRTGTNEQPGWIAAPCGPGDIEPDTMPTTQAAQSARARVVGGAALIWRKRQLCVLVALEQRGDILTSLPDGLLAHVERLELCATIPRGITQRRLELVRNPEPLGGLSMPDPSRLEACFVIEPSIFKEHRAASGQLWLLLHTSRSLLPLPPEWNTFWFQLDLSEPSGMVY